MTTNEAAERLRRKTGSRNLRCAKCGRRFKRAGSLAIHLNNHREADAQYRRQTGVQP